MSEKDLVKQIAQYLQLQYPGVIYRFDLAADLRLSIYQARCHKELHPYRGYPDLFICEPRNGRAGLFLEIKNTNIYKKDGSLKSSQHLKEQACMLEELENRGYIARFACGFEGAKQIIDRYLK